MSFHDGFLGYPNYGFILQFLLVVAIIIALQAYYQDNVANRVFAPEGNPHNVNYSTSLIQRQPIQQCQEDLENWEDQLCTDVKGVARTISNEQQKIATAIDLLIAAIVNKFQSKILVPVILPQFLDNQGHNLDSRTGQEPRENVWPKGGYGGLAKEGKAAQGTDQMTSTSQHLVTVDLMVKSCRDESASNRDFGPHNEEIETAQSFPLDIQDSVAFNDCSTVNVNAEVTDISVQLHEGTDESSYSDGDASDVGPYNRVGGLERSRQFDSDHANLPVDGAAEIAETTESVPVGIQDSVAVSDGIIVNASVPVTDSSELLDEEADDVSKSGDEESASGDKLEDEESRGRQTTKEESLKLFKVDEIG